MIEGFGVHTFRFVNAKGKATFVKFHWRPKLGSAAVLWDEALKINGADPDFHRRDLWDAIDKGDFPEFEFAVQAFDEKTANGLGFDVLDATKLIPEETVPLQVIGTMVLNRSPDNFFSETEQVAFHPGHVVPGIDFTNDPLLQGRLHSYTDTQLSRLGGPNFHGLPINAPKCPMHNFQRDGIMRMAVPQGRVAYEPNTLAPDGPREHPQGFQSFPDPESGPKLRARSESFSDHYSHARLFWTSMTEPEQRHGPKVGGAAGTHGTIPVDHAVSAGPSLFFDAVVVAVATDGVEALGDEGAAIDWVRNAFGHLKVIGYTSWSQSLLGRAGVSAGDGVVAIDGRKGVRAFIDAARHGRIWGREPGIRNPEA